jgi:hypothetical protein
MIFEKQNIYCLSTYPTDRDFAFDIAKIKHMQAQQKFETSQACYQLSHAVLPPKIKYFKMTEND